MLQQTQVETVIPYFQRFMSRFPNVQALASAPLQDVLKAWENMGYYGRARHLHAAAKEVVDRWEGTVPSTYEDLTSLPGIGKYTAGAVLSIAYGQQVAAVDGNVRRVLSRLFAIDEPLDLGSTQQHLYRLAEELVPSEDPGLYNQAIMDLGATVCKAQRPLCRSCPVEDLCQAAELGLQGVLPIRRKRGPVPHEDVTAGVIRDDNGRLLIVQRPGEGLLGGLWKFPGGKREDGLPLINALRESVRQELGISIQVGEGFASIDHVYTHFRITLHAFYCAYREGQPRALRCADWRWVAPHELVEFPFSKADREIIHALNRNIHEPRLPQM
jgi:A/G-specific adenine glycosylase